MDTMRTARRLTAAAAATTLVLASPAAADISIEFDNLISGPVGTVRTVAEDTVPPELVGDTCRISVIAENQASVHPGNDLIVSTGDSQAVFVGVEDEANGGTTETYEVVVGPTIVVQLRFGPDELSSLGFELSFDCTPNPNTGLQTGTSTTVPPTTVTPTTSISTSTTVTTAPPAIEPPTTAPPATDPPATASPATEPPTTAPPTSAIQQGPTTTGPPPTLDQQTVHDDLPASPVAEAIVAAPAYAG